jgi:hypothetical protein
MIPALQTTPVHQSSMVVVIPVVEELQENGSMAMKMPRCFYSNCKGATTVKEIYFKDKKNLAYVCLKCDLVLGYIPDHELKHWQTWDKEEFDAEQEVVAMKADQLAGVPYEDRKWLCCVDGCSNGTRIKDYGFTVNPWYLYTRWGWLNLTGQYYYCGKHNKAHREGENLLLKPGSGFDHLEDWPTGQQIRSKKM